MTPASNIIQLRELLAARHPQAVALRAAGCFESGMAALDAALDGGLAQGAITEIVALGGGTLFLAALVETVAQRRAFGALIEGGDAFDATAWPQAVLARWLWVRAGTAALALKAADLLLRDGNLPLIVLDLRGAAAAETRQIPATSWYRFQRVVEPTDTALVVLTARALVSGARARMQLDARFTLAAFDLPATRLLSEVGVECLHEAGGFRSFRSFRQN